MKMPGVSIPKAMGPKAARPTMPVGAPAPNMVRDGRGVGVPATLSGLAALAKPNVRRMRVPKV